MHRLRTRTAYFLPLTLASLSAWVATTSGCGTVEEPPQTPPEGPALRPGDICNPPNPISVGIRFEPSFVVVAPCSGDAASCSKRKVEVVVDPDFCTPTPVAFESDNPDVAPVPAEGSVGLYEPLVELDVVGGKVEGTAQIRARIAKGDGTDAEATLSVDVLAPTQLACSGAAAADALVAGDTLRGEGGLLGATIGVPERANEPNSGSYLWSVEPFSADITCGDDQTPSGYVDLGPAITFGPMEASFQRDLPMSIPINPARLPDAARWRHLRIVYSGPGFATPRVVPVTDPRVEKIDGQWAVSFRAPRLGTYQAVALADAGKTSRKRRLTHRALIGVSMGGMGTSMFGMRNHHLFDVLAPLGGPASWAWLLHYIENNHLGGFRPIAPGTQLADIQIEKTTCTSDAQCAADETCLGIVGTTPGRCTLLGAPTDPYEHTQTFVNWWAEYPRTGTGGSFPRSEYAQIFRDLSLMFGNPNGDNLTAGGENLPAGVHPEDPSQTGDHPNGECKVWVDPLDGPDEEKQKQIADSCPVDRCARTLTLQNYFDDEYNPDGTFPVITVCDGTPTNEALTPYANTWTAAGPNDYPLEVGLAVDYNANGVRDELEPIIRSSSEPYEDVGPDGLPSELEPGYAPGINDDPAGDDYHAQYNPGGLERNYRYDAGEPFLDVGLDGVAGTPQQPAYPTGYQSPGDGYDVGEGDGVFTATRGLSRMWAHDPGAIARRQSVEIPGGDLTDEALSRLDVWTDGGLRDIFNFHVSAQTLAGSFVARNRDVAYFSDFTQVPGLDPSAPDVFLPPRIVYKDLQGIVMQRYGVDDPTEKEIDNGNGQHVGTANQIAARLQTALYFIGSRWDDPMLRTLVEDSDSNPAPDADGCEIIGNCTFDFEATDGRVGPVSVTLPPGYGHALQQDRRYPVIYMLHGYGQTPEDLQAAIVFLRNWMNSPSDGNASRLAKAIIVYVDGRCRVGADDQAECIRGTFYVNSPRQGGVQSEQWFLELMDHIDQRFRTLGEREADWVE